MFDWGRYVDAVYLVHFTGDKWRDRYLDPELRRIGLSGSGLLHVRHTCPKPFYGAIAKSVADNGREKPREYAIDLVHETLSILSDAVENGYSRIMVMEDDVVFAKDLGCVRKALDRVPQSFDVLHLEWVTSYEGSLPTDAGPWIPSDNFRTSGEGCALFSRDGMSRMSEALMGDSFQPIDVVSRRLPGCYISSPRLAIQLPFLSSGSGGADGFAGHVMSEDWRRYAVPCDFIPGVGVVPDSDCFKRVSELLVRAVSENAASGRVSDITFSRVYRAASAVKDRNPSLYAAVLAVLMMGRADCPRPFMEMARLCHPDSFKNGERKSLLKLAADAVSDEFDDSGDQDALFDIPGPKPIDAPHDWLKEKMEPLFRDIVYDSEPGDLDGPDGDLIRFAVYQLPEWKETEPHEDS